MNNIVDAARSAREKLAEALGLLQAPEASSVADTVAEPVAKAMGALHRIESSGGAELGLNGPQALLYVREALNQLQVAPTDHPIVEQATERVAGSLGLVHGLAQKAESMLSQTGNGRSPAAEALGSTAISPGNATPAAAQPVAAPAAAVAAPAAVAVPAAAAAVAATQVMQQPVIEAPVPRHSPEEAFEKTAMASRSPVAHLEIPRTQPLDSKRAPAPESGRPPEAEIVEANLGAHSPTNFYKGLSGNDIIQDGGIFIATYKIPSIGSEIWLKVTLPGGYEFEAAALVRWTREGRGADNPGFGAAFRSLSPEAKQLIYRYVRNREPLFYDDL